MAGNQKLLSGEGLPRENQQQSATVGDNSNRLSTSIRGRGRSGSRTRRASGDSRRVSLSDPVEEGPSPNTKVVVPPGLLAAGSSPVGSIDDDDLLALRITGTIPDLSKKPVLSLMDPVTGTCTYAFAVGIHYSPLVSSAKASSVIRASAEDVVRTNNIITAEVQRRRRIPVRGKPIGAQVKSPDASDTPGERSADSKPLVGP